MALESCQHALLGPLVDDQFSRLEDLNSEVSSLGATVEEVAATADGVATTADTADTLADGVPGTAHETETVVEIITGVYLFRAGQSVYDRR